MSNLPASIPTAAGAQLRLSLRIRPMRLDDIPQVSAIDRLSFNLPWPESSFRYELLENPRSLLRVTEIDLPGGGPQVVGAIVVWLILDEAHIATLAVHPDHRRSGVARRLMMDLLREIIPQGTRLVTLEVRESNLPAQSLYHRFNFSVVGRRLRYYHDNYEDALIMSLDNLDGAYLDWLERSGWQEGEAA